MNSLKLAVIEYQKTHPGLTEKQAVQEMMSQAKYADLFHGVDLYAIQESPEKLQELLSAPNEPIGDNLSFKGKPAEDDLVGKWAGEVPKPAEKDAGFWGALGLAGMAVVTFLTRGKVKPKLANSFAKGAETFTKTAKVTGGAVATGVAMASCADGLVDEPDVYHKEEKNISITIDFAGIVEKLEELIAQNNEFKTIFESMKTTIEDLKKEIEESHAENKAYQTTVQNQLNQIIKMLGELKKGDDEKAALLQKILVAIEAGNVSNASMLNQILGALDALSTEQTEYNKESIALLNEILTKITAGNTQDAAFYEEVMNFIKACNEKGEEYAAILKEISADIKAGNKVNQKGFEAVVAAIAALEKAGNENTATIVDVITNLWDDIKSGKDDVITAINNLASSSVANNEELMAVIKEIYADSQLNAEERNNKVLEAINNVSGAITNLGTTIEAAGDEICAEIKGLKADLQAILDSIKGGFTPFEDALLLLKDVLAELQKNNALSEDSNAMLAELLKKANEILAKPGADVIDYSGVLNDILAAIKDGDAGIIAEIQKLRQEQADQVAELKAEFKDGTGAIVDAIANLENVVKSSSLDLTTTNNLIQTVIDLMGTPSSGNTTFDPTTIEALLGKTNEMMAELLAKEGPDMSVFANALAEIKDAIKNIKVNGAGVDLTTTNNLIQSCIDQLGALVQAQSNSTDIMAGVTNLGTQLTAVIAQLQSGNVTTDEINAKLDAIMAEIQKLAG